MSWCGFALALLISCSAAVAAPPDEESLERFLARLGLNELQMRQLERLVDSDVPPKERTALAKRLADLYAGRLMSSSRDQQRYDDTVRRITTLIAKVPEAKTASLEVMRLQADYNRAEALVAVWIEDHTKTKERDEARAILAKIGPALDARRRELFATVNELIESLDNMPEEDPGYREVEQKLNQTQTVAGRAAYFAAWSSYYLGLTTPEKAKEQYALARAIFQELMGIDGEKYAEVEPDWLGMETLARARSVIGLGLSESALGNLADSQTCFKWLQHASVPPDIQDEAPYWYLQGLLNAGRLKEAVDFAREQITSFAGKPTRGRVSMCVSLARAGFAGGAATEITRQAGMVGLAGLAKLRQQSKINELISKYNIDLENATGFYLNWINARKRVAEADAAEVKETALAAAIAAFEKALQQPDAKANTGAASQCRYEQGWAYYKAGQFEQAGRAFEQALIGLKAAADAGAPDAAWMAFVAYNKLVKKQPRFVTPAVDMLETIKRDFPNHQYAKKADYFIAKVRRSSASPAQMIRDLSNVKPGAPTYLAARYDLCTLLHQQWTTAKEDDQRRGLEKQLRSAVEVFFKADGEKEPRRLARCLLYAADAALNGPDAKLDDAQAYLDRARPIVDSLATKDSTVALHHFHALQLATQRNRDADRKRHATWLVQNASGSVYELPAMIVMVKAAEKSLAAASEQQRRALKQELLDYYQRLSPLLGDSPAKLSTSKNARVAASKLAHYAFEAKQYASAASRLEDLLVVFPKEEKYLRRAGLAQFHAGNHPAAIGHWRTLVRGLKKGGDDWYEAKYYQMASLERINKADAKRTFNQFKLLYPELGPADWRAKFRELGARLK